ncbi:MAG TPA: uroporphyrinogen-III C-methyltransferase [Microlunatus sp.]|nr:uroporphyrinogen-III C-methyltransferase [Microlunatus sp.]
MIGGFDLTDREVLLIGTETGSRRATARYRAAGARVRRLTESALPLSGDAPGWRALLASVALCVIVEAAEHRAEQLRRYGRRFGVLIGSEPAAVSSGRVTLIGGGPGPEDLLTVAAVRALAEADVVCYDRLAPHGRLAELAPAAELIDVGKRPYHHPVGQDGINELIVRHARAGRAVVRLKGGDPYVFGRGAEEVAACREAGIEVRVLPGVTSAVAVPGAAGIPVTRRGVSRSVTVLSGHELPPAEELAALARLGGTLVIMMGVANLPQLGAGLVRAGMDPATPAAVVERGFRPGQRTTVSTLGGLPGEASRVGVRSPAVIVLGEVVRCATDAHQVLSMIGVP